MNAAYKRGYGVELGRSSGLGWWRRGRPHRNPVLTTQLGPGKLASLDNLKANWRGWSDMGAGAKAVRWCCHADHVLFNFVTLGMYIISL